MLVSYSCEGLFMVQLYTFPYLYFMTVRGLVANSTCIKCCISCCDRIILRHRKTAKTNTVKDQVNSVAETALYEPMLGRLKGNRKDETSPWDLFFGLDENSVSDLNMCQ